MPGKRNAGGCSCNCVCACTIAGTVTGCQGGVSATVPTALAGVRVSWAGPESGSTTTGVGGSFGFCVSATGTYTLSYSKSGYCSATRTAVVASCGGGHGGASVSNTVLSLAVLPVKVSGCFDVLPGATVTVTLDAGGTFSTGTTDGAGVANVNVPCGAVGYTVTASYPGPRFGTASQHLATGTGTTCKVSLTLPAAAGYHCFPCCNLPVLDTLHFTDSVYGSGTVSYASFGIYNGTLSAPYPGFCGCAPVNPISLSYGLTANPGPDCTLTGYNAGSSGTDLNGTTGCPGVPPMTINFNLQISMVSRTCPPSFSFVGTIASQFCLTNGGRLYLPGATVTFTE